MPERTMTRAELEEVLTRNEKNEAQELAQRLVPKAIDTLESVMKARKAPHSSKVQAAKAILDEAVGKPGTQRPQAPIGEGTGIVINILSVSDSTTESLKLDVKDSRSREAAERLIESHPGIRIQQFAPEEVPEVDPDEPW